MDDSSVHASLQRIIDAATGDEPLRTVVQLLKVHGHRTSNQALIDWAARELNGYATGTKVPPYRGAFEFQVFGHFRHPYGPSKVTAIDKIRFPKETHDGILFNHQYRESLSVLQGYAEQPGLTFGWDPNYVLGYNVMVAHGKLPRVMPEPWHLETAQVNITPAHIQGVLDGIRDAALQIALDLENSEPYPAQTAEPTTTPTEKAGPINVTNNFNFNNANLSGSNNAIGGSDFQQTYTAITPGDRTALHETLKKEGVSEEQLGELDAAIDADGPNAADAGVGSNVRNWLSSMAGKVAVPVATTITQAILLYFGLPSLAE